MSLVKIAVEACKNIHKFIEFLHNKKFHQKVCHEIEMFYTKQGVHIPNLNEELRGHRIRCSAIDINFGVDMLMWTSLIVLLLAILIIICPCKYNLILLGSEVFLSSIINGVILIFNFIYVSSLILSEPSNEERRIFKS